MQGLWQDRSAADEGDFEVLPDGRAELVIELNESEPRALLYGPASRPLRWPVRPSTEYLGIRFWPAGARRWLAGDVTAAVDAVWQLDRFGRTAVEQLIDELATSPPEERPSIVERWLGRAQLTGGALASPDLAEFAAAELVRAHGALRIEALAERAGVSRRTLERVVKAELGLPPKVLASVLRFQRALELLDGGLPASIAALDAGYADQAHLSREFRRFAGRPPGQR